jgi:hypothetical protein
MVLDVTVLERIRVWETAWCCSSLYHCLWSWCLPCSCKMSYVKVEREKLVDLTVIPTLLRHLEMRLVCVSWSFILQPICLKKGFKYHACKDSAPWGLLVCWLVWFGLVWLVGLVGWLVSCMCLPLSPVITSNYVMNFPEYGYEEKSYLGHPTFVHFNFRLSLILTWRPYELIRWAQH